MGPCSAGHTLWPIVSLSWPYDMDKLATWALPGAYGLPEGLTEEELRKCLTWLIQELKLIHPDISVKVSNLSESIYFMLMFCRL